ncbi:MAG TPA: L-lactate permease [Candidatus Dormibacteraeota bacterium]|nr:L-lactate permease [Candidatus Dormibacteraeota bacterium]
MPILAAGFQQILSPAGPLAASTLLALVPVVLLLVLLAVFRLTAWLSVLIGSVVTVLLGIGVWRAPLLPTLAAYGYGAATGVWSVDWITFWGVVIFYTLNVTGLFQRFQGWLTEQATADVRVQAILLAWAFGALLEGLVGFGYPWAVVAPILIALGVAELDAIRVAAIANNAPVSYGALGAPLIALAAVTHLDLLQVSASVGRLVAILAILPPFVLIYLVSGWKGLKDGWPLAVVGTVAYVAGQYPTSQFLGPYLPDIIGSLVCFGALLLLLRVWRPRTTLGYGGVEVSPLPVGGGATPQAAVPRSSDQVLKALLPFVILVLVVVAWTGPWSPLPKISAFHASAAAVSSLPGHRAVAAEFNWTPFIAGTSIAVSWLLILLVVRPSLAAIGTVFKRTLRQMWGALLVGFFIFGLAYVFNYSGMAATLAYGFSKVGVVFIVLAPILGWIGVALSGSNTSTNTLFGFFQLSVGRLLGFPLLLLPSLNSVGAEVGKPVAPQTTSVGVSTTSYARNEGAAIRHNLAWTLVLLLYLIGIGCFYYFVLPAAMR